MERATWVVCAALALGCSPPTQDTTGTGGTGGNEALLGGDVWAPAAGEAPLTLRVADGTAKGYDAIPVHAAVLPAPAAGGGHDPDQYQLAFIGYARDAAGKKQRLTFTLPVTPSVIPANPPVSGAVVEVASHKPDYRAPLQDNLFCGGQTLMADGRLFVAGGTHVASGNADDPHHPEGDDADPDAPIRYGLDYAMAFSTGVAGAAGWTDLPGNMVGPGENGTLWRWYPTATRLASGKILVTGGWERIPNKNDPASHVPNTSIEVYGSGWEGVIYHHGTPPPNEFMSTGRILNPEYPFLYQLPAKVDDTRDVVAFGSSGHPILLSSEGSAAAKVLEVRRPDHEAPIGLVCVEPWKLDCHTVQASSAMLPLRLDSGEWGYENGSVLIVGGLPVSDPESEFAAQGDVFDPAAIGSAGGPWIYDNAIRMKDGNTVVERVHSDALLLPDGQILVLLGYNASPECTAECGNDCASCPTTRAHYIRFFRKDGERQVEVSIGSSSGGEIRQYHNIAVLLPDGRVLAAGGLPPNGFIAEDEQHTFRYYSPRYLGYPRPQFSSEPSEPTDVVITRGEPFDVHWAFDAPVPTELVLMALPAMTHGLDMNQRYVQVAVETVGTRHLKATPPAALSAPAGYYMMFLVYEGGPGGRVPSVAKIVQLVDP